MAFKVSIVDDSRATREPTATAVEGVAGCQALEPDARRSIESRRFTASASVQ